MIDKSESELMTGYSLKLNSKCNKNFISPIGSLQWFRLKKMLLSYVYAESEVNYTYRLIILFKDRCGY